MPDTAASVETTSPGATLAAIRAAAPLVQNITNFVAMDLVANLLLAVGASPAMAHAKDEVSEFVPLAGALTVNTGTFTPEWMAGAVRAAETAQARGVPWVLDPVAAQATSFRLGNARELARRRPSLIRGNASEIIALAGGAEAGGKGVDSTAAADAAAEAAGRLARQAGCVVVVTGAVDLVTDGTRSATCGNGHPLMTRVTAVGCALTGLTGACLAVERRPMVAALHALAILGVAGERAAARARGPGSFRVALLDELWQLDPAELDAEARLA